MFDFSKVSFLMGFSRCEVLTIDESLLSKISIAVVNYMKIAV